MKNEKPRVVKIHDVQIDSKYVQWLNEVKSRYRSAQIKAAVKVNAEQLLFNWQLGRDLVTRKAEEQWGSGVVEQLSMDLQAAFPESKGFSTTNLWRMKQWYQFYSNELKKLPQLAGELTASQKLAQLGREISDVPSSTNDSIAFPKYFAFVPWKHHVAIVSKCESVEEALFYVVKCINEGWSRNTLENFSEKLPSPQSEMSQEITKDTYDLGFLTLPDGYDEEKLETELEKQLTRFLLELGTGFAYLGRQKQIIVAGKTC